MMHHLIFIQIVKAGVSCWLLKYEHYYINGEGEIVESIIYSVGLKVEVEIVHTGWILFGNDVDTDISQKDDDSVSKK